MKKSCAVFVLAAAASVHPSFAQAPAAAPAPCTAAEYRQFDFWLGEWDVTPAGKTQPGATNTISAAHGGCVILEEYKAGAFTGMSVSFYDSALKRWRQTWMSAAGRPLYLSGGLDEAGAMAMSDEGLPSSQASGAINRLTWSATENGAVRQLWEQSKDGGESWAVIYDGLYTKKAAD